VHEKGEGRLSDRRSSTGGDRIAVTAIDGVEEDIWSPCYGLKGKIDVSVQATIVGDGGKQESHVLPFEIKTGRWTSAGENEHRAQTMLYTLLMGDRYSKCSAAHIPGTEELKRLL
jgi:DNA replication ATP-dependent helicase Dna2